MRVGEGMTVGTAARASLIQLKLKLKLETRHYSSAPFSLPSVYSSSAARAPSFNLKLPSAGSQRPIVFCNSGSRPGGSSSGDNESSDILDAFFLGKALAETLNERLESTIGEFLSTIGRLQAEQQKQVQDFQEEVFERAKRAKEKAARESMEAQELIPNSTDAADVTPVAAGSQPTSSSNTPLNSYSKRQSNPPTNTASAISPESENPALAQDE
ncbi:hypothetical protein SAY87_026225 [Trapa incisa]|uniref:Uncharacterized protein n=1 Tax=Trapa incisa TaxID=236973 RepID=A0AAN7JKX6_9MYRT|nr:hypothetical protein SAY87_026225 [Trapa incisa]